MSGCIPSERGVNKIHIFKKGRGKHLNISPKICMIAVFCVNSHGAKRAEKVKRVYVPSIIWMFRNENKYVTTKNHVPSSACCFIHAISSYNICTLDSLE